jgi:hypothetical protein
MPTTLQILGVYFLDVTERVFLEQLPMYGNEDQCRDHFSSVVLIEAIIHSEGELFSLGDFTQPNAAYRRVSPQAPWDEGMLSADGETLISRRINCVKGNGPLRFAFYMHYWDASLPLRWTYGEVACPPPADMPVRLELLMPYRPCD